MSWCDKLASVPGVGFRLNTHYAPSDSLLSAMSKVLDPLIKNDKPQFRVTHQQSFDVQFNTDEGFHYAIEPTKISVTFAHKMRARPISGGLPVMEMLSKALPYTQFLPVVGKKAIEATSFLNEGHKRTVNRLGIISSTMVSAQDIPPGISRFIEYIGRPWSGKLDDFAIAITSETGKGNNYRDRCIHTIKNSEDVDELMSITFDWQRIFTNERPATRDALTMLFEEGQRTALKYFEDVGEGRRFDEKLIREAAGV